MSPVGPIDDPTIDDDEVLIRGISPQYFRPGDRISAGAFRTQEMSVFIERETSVAAVAGTLPGWGMRRLTTKAFRKAGGIIVRAPEGGQGHCHVLPKDNLTGRLTPSNAEDLTEVGEWVTGYSPSDLRA